jgi:hypothetical protein
VIPYTDAGAEFDRTRRYRRRLWRRWEQGAGIAVFIMLNPSTADAGRDDPTMRRCAGFARDWGFAGFEAVNLYDFRATSPRDLFAARRPCSSANDAAIVAAASSADLTVAAWGAHAKPSRAAAVLELLERERMDVHALALTKDGQPRHPLYLRRDRRPFPLKPAAAP